MELEDENGKVYSSRHFKESSRINLYRRGPYFCEVHWFDIQPTSADGEVAPLKGDLTLYCYPEKMLAEIAWHADADFDGGTLKVKGIAPAEFDYKSFVAGTKQVFNFPLFGEEEPLPDQAFTMIEGKVPLKYNSRKRIKISITYSYFRVGFFFYYIN